MIQSSKRIANNIPLLVPNENETDTWKLSSAHNIKKKTHTERKYSVPIAPHMEKLELPGSYDNDNQLSRHQGDRYSMLSRQYPLPSTIPRAYVSSTNSSTPTAFYYS
ncbi:hypothetical protein [Parasitella parasitica]|uniref:Uncharacterized protein n=1 Tax=Parasitella parasitica TaxID=35722 RepID=A0A0B7NB66_9FUNG|nr:hypothetical protein [Parasitella parasitica]